MEDGRALGRGELGPECHGVGGVRDGSVRLGSAHFGHPENFKPGRGIDHRDCVAVVGVGPRAADEALRSYQALILDADHVREGVDAREVPLGVAVVASSRVLVVASREILNCPDLRDSLRALPSHVAVRLGDERGAVQRAKLNGDGVGGTAKHGGAVVSTVRSARPEDSTC